jgi:hypothetical protein
VISYRFLAGRGDIGPVTARLALLGTTALATIAAGLFLYARRTDESWYGISLGQKVEEVANVRVEPATTTYPEVGIVDPPPPPWSQIRLSAGRGTHRITDIEFTDLGREQWVCDVSPCPQAPRLKPVAQTRAEGARVKSDLMDRMGAPTSSYGSGNETTFIWDFGDPGLACVNGRLQPRILAGDRSGLVRRVTLGLSDDAVSLEVASREYFEPVPGVFAPPSPPEPPRPPPPCP